MRRHIDRLEAGFHRLTFALAALTAVSIGLITLLIPLNLLLIRMRWGSMWWLYEAVEYTLYAGVFIGAPWVLRLGAHVRVDVLITAIPRNLALQLERVMNVVGMLLCLVLCYYGLRATRSEYVYGTLPDKDLRIDNWYVMALFSAAFLLLAIEFLFRIRRTCSSRDTPDAAAARTGF